MKNKTQEICELIDLIYGHVVKPVSYAGEI
jgi:hypothetical protein